MKPVVDDAAGAPAARPLVSIGVPVLNGERYLREALDSVLCQSVEDFEVVISDNASADRTEDIAREYARSDKRVRYIRHSRQRGASYNFNFVATASRGRYFKWAAHDDTIGPDLLADCLEVLESDDEVVLCHPRACEIDASGSIVRRFPPTGYGSEPEVPRRVRAYFSHKTACLEAYGVMRRGALLDTRMIGDYLASDRVFLLEMVMRGRVQQLPQAAFNCRKHDERSLERYERAADRRAWFAGPDGRTSYVFPKWRLAREFSAAVRRAPISTQEKVGCLSAVAGWSASNAVPLAREVGSAVKTFVHERRRSAPVTGRESGVA